MSELQALDEDMDGKELKDSAGPTDGEHDPTPVAPAHTLALEARIAELQRQLADLGASAGSRVLPAANPDDLIEWNAPAHPVEGIAYTINGKKFGPGKVTTKRRIADQIMADHGRALRIEAERLMNRGSEIDPAAINRYDFISRLKQRTRGQRHPSVN